jgi:3-deoxy-D-manno-octulosonate 8-phosphate phosphatase (KDO 8-P phosphatase)
VMAEVEELEERLRRVRILLVDVDGVLTDGMVVWDNHGIEQKAFHIRDGLGIKLWLKSGGLTGIVTGRSSHVVELRAGELGIGLVRQGVTDKRATVAAILDEHGLAWEEAAFVGDDLPDLPVVEACGVGVAVADACGELRAAADLVTQAAGGRGAVREVVERLLLARGEWDAIVRRYQVGQP